MSRSNWNEAEKHAKAVLYYDYEVSSDNEKHSKELWLLLAKLSCNSAMKWAKRFWRRYDQLKSSRRSPKNNKLSRLHKDVACPLFFHSFFSW